MDREILKQNNALDDANTFLIILKETARSSPVSQLFNRDTSDKIAAFVRIFRAGGVPSLAKGFVALAELLATWQPRLQQNSTAKNRFSDPFEKQLSALHNMIGQMTISLQL
jgi:hypothetical protein